MSIRDRGASSRLINRERLVQSYGSDINSESEMDERPASRPARLNASLLHPQAERSDKPADNTGEIPSPSSSSPSGHLYERKVPHGHTHSMLTTGSMGGMYDAGADERNSHSLSHASSYGPAYGPGYGGREGGSISDTGVDQSRKAKIYSKYRKKIRRKTHLPKRETERLRVQTPQFLQRSIGTDLTQDAETFRVSAFCVCDRYNLPDIIEYVESIEGFADSVVLYADVVQIKQKHLKRDTFVFSYGCVCFFNVPEAYEGRMLRMLRSFEIGSLPSAQHQFEEVDCRYGDHSSVSNDQITLKSRSSLEKLSVAFAMSQCVKLGVYEDRISVEMDKHQKLAVSLARTGSVGLSQPEISQLMGALFIERNNVNLHFDVLDTPEFFWEQDRYKSLYDRLFNYLELGKRVELLNKRLDITKELLDILTQEQQAQYVSKCDKLIIWLLFLEVVIKITWQIMVKDVLGFFPGA